MLKRDKRDLECRLTAEIKHQLKRVDKRNIFIHERDVEIAKLNAQIVNIKAEHEKSINNCSSRGSSPPPLGPANPRSFENYKAGFNLHSKMNALQEDKAVLETEVEALRRDKSLLETSLKKCEDDKLQFEYQAYKLAEILKGISLQHNNPKN